MEHKLIVGWSTKKVDWGLAALIACALALAWVNRFVQDDAFISFRYARNLAEGHGLVWNIGERVEGYTNFLWTLCMAPAFLFGIEPVFYSYVLSLTAYCCTLAISYRLSCERWNSRAAGLVCMFLLATNFSFSSYATGGLETQFGIAWVMAAVFLLGRWRRHGKRTWPLLCAGLASACAVMTRMDAVILLFPFWLGEGFSVWHEGNRRQLSQLGVAVGLAAVPVVGWLIWRHGYYGEWVPNTLLIKSTGASWIRGIYYVGLFYLVYGLWLVLPVCLSGAMQLPKDLYVVCAGIGWLLWQTYVVAIGGDFMEFRMMLPALPLFFIFVAGGVLKGCKTHYGRVSMVAALILCSGAHGMIQKAYPGIQSIRELKACYIEWREAADTLNRCLGDGRDTVKIAVTAAGVIPYYTHCKTLDLLGLNDRAIALNGERVEPVNRWLGTRPGHVRIADRETVMARGVNLLLNMPWVTDAKGWTGRSAREICGTWSLGADSDMRRVHAMRVRYMLGPSEAAPRVVAWPLGDGRYLMSLYVCPSPAVDDAIVRCCAQVIGDRR